MANKMLEALPRKDYLALQPHIGQVNLDFGSVLYESGDTIREVYFPDNCVVSLLTLVDRHSALEVGLVGYEGMVGLPLALGSKVSPVRALVQGRGGAGRMSAARFLAAIDASPALQHSLRTYTYGLMAQITQTAACNRFHRVEARLARWLLMTRDRIGSARFRLTHEFLGNMLGVRRVGVTTAASSLQRRKLIEYRRGEIRIIDGSGLEAAACTCYALPR